MKTQLAWLALALWTAAAAAQEPSDALHATLIVRQSTVRFDPSLPGMTDRLRALETPDAARYEPDVHPTPLDGLVGSGTTPTPERLAAAARYQQEQARQQREADARYRAAYGDAPRALRRRRIEQHDMRACRPAPRSCRPAAPPRWILGTLAFPVPPPAVDLIFRIENRGTRAVSLRSSGDMVRWRLRLSGPAAHHVLGGGDPTEIFLVGQLETIPPGGHVDLPISSLRYGDRGTWLGAYWTAPGRYTLELALDTVVGAGLGATTHVRLRAAPVQLDVR